MSERSRNGRFGRVGRRPDHWASQHERARVRAAERLEEPLPAGEESWLESHLAACEPCRAIAEAYATDRLALRQLRAEPAEPPRDLWARTAAGIERESGARRPVPRPTRSRRATSLPALGALSGVAVVAVVVVATAISGGFLGHIGRNSAGATAPVAVASLSITPQPTAITVGAGKVHWLGTGADGALAYNVADIDVVCPLDRQPDCAPFADGHAKRVTISATPKFIFQSPVDAQAVVVGRDASGADAVLVVTLPTPDPTPEAATGSPEASTGPSDSPAPTPGATSSAVPPPLAPTDPPTVSASDVSPTVLVSTAPSGSGVPSEVPATTAAVAIITDVTVVGRAAAYSPDGAWFAFSARPADGSFGPDIYIWRVGDPLARALTADHASLFASWVWGSLLGSRVLPEPAGEPEASPVVDPSLEVTPSIEVPSTPDASPVVEVTTAPESLPQTFLLDPSTGAEIARLDTEWQPAVDPTGLAVVAWQGTVALGGDGFTAAPATGNLVIHSFHGPFQGGEPLGSDSPQPFVSASPPPSAEPSATPDASAEISPSASPPVPGDFPVQVVAAGPIADFDVRWDDTGSWLAIWIADPVDPGLGRLSLLHFDPASGRIDRPIGAPQDVTALPGFSIGFGRLAWASPPGQGGEGSRIQIAAWTSDEVGAVESIPVEGAIVVQ